MGCDRAQTSNISLVPQPPPPPKIPTSQIRRKIATYWVVTLGFYFQWVLLTFTAFNLPWGNRRKKNRKKDFIINLEAPVITKRNFQNVPRVIQKKTDVNTVSAADSEQCLVTEKYNFIIIIIIASSSSIGTATLVGFGLLNYPWVFSAGRFLQSAVASGTSNPQLGGPVIRTF